MKKHNVALVDDNDLFCRSLESLINTFPEYSVLFTASDGLDFINKISENLKPDLVIMDQLMPIMDGFETVIWLKRNFPDVKVIVLSMNHNEETVLKMVKSGVKGYLLKDAELNEFKHAIDAVCNGNYYCPQYVTNYLVNRVSQPVPEEKTALHHLSDHEIEFIRLASSELTYNEIAAAMCLNLRTVENYRDKLFQKFNLKNRVGLVLYAVKNKLIEPL